MEFSRDFLYSSFDILVISSASNSICVDPASLVGIASKNTNSTLLFSSTLSHSDIGLFNFATANAASFTALLLPCGTAKPASNPVGESASLSKTAL